MTIVVPSQAWVQRPDLAISRWTRPALIGSRILPTYPCSKKSDVIVYMPVRDNSLTAQTGRTMGDSFDITNIDNVRIALDLTAAEIASTQTKDISDIADQGDLERNLWQMSMNSKAVVAYALENATAVALLDGKAEVASATEKAFIKNVREKRQAIASQLGDGKIIVAMSAAVYNTIIAMTEIQAQLGKGVSLPVTQDTTVANLQRIQLAAIFGVDEVLIGQNRAWYADNITTKDAVVVAMVAEPNQDPTFMPQLGRTPVFTQYLAEPTPTDPNAGMMDYDNALLIPGQAAKVYATPFSCAQIVIPQNNAVGVVTQTFAKPVLFTENTDLFEVVALPPEVMPSAST